MAVADPFPVQGAGTQTFLVQEIADGVQDEQRRPTKRAGLTPEELADRYGRLRRLAAGAAADC